MFELGLTLIPALSLPNQMIYNDIYRHGEGAVRCPKQLPRPAGKLFRMTKTETGKWPG